MDIKEILSMVDHTILKPEATWNEVKATCDDAINMALPSSAFRHLLLSI